MGELTVTGLRAGYGAMQVVHDVHLRLPAGEVVALVGRNGAGKTTTLQAIAGLRSGAFGGRVQLDGTDISQWSPSRMAKAGFAFVPDGHRVLVGMTVEENLRIGGFPMRRDKRALEDAHAWVVDLFPDLAVSRYRHAEQLSGGQQQMLAIGMALMCRPKFLLLDEPCGGLAPALVDRIYEVVERLAAEGQGVLVVEQDVQRAMRRSARTYVMDQGRIVIDGPSSELLGNTKILDLVRGIVDVVEGDEMTPSVS